MSKASPSVSVPFFGQDGVPLMGGKSDAETPAAISTFHSLEPSWRLRHERIFDNIGSVFMRSRPFATLSRDTHVHQQSVLHFGYDRCDSLAIVAFELSLLSFLHKTGCRLL